MSPVLAGLTGRGGLGASRAHPLKKKELLILGLLIED